MPGPVLGWRPEVNPAWALFSSLVYRSKLISYPQPVSLSHDYRHHRLFLWCFLHPGYPLLSAPILQNLCSLLRFARVAFSIPPPLVFPFPPNFCNIPVLCSVAYNLNGLTWVTILGVWTSLLWGLESYFTLNLFLTLPSHLNTPPNWAHGKCPINTVGF